MKRDYVAFCSLLWHPDEERLYCGLTAMDGNVLAKFDPAAKRFEPLDYRPIAEPFEFRIHRSLERAGDGTICGATGGQLCRLDPKTAEVVYLGKPAPTTRLPGLVPWRDGLLLGAAGDNEGGCIFAYDRESGAFHMLGPVHDTEANRTLFRVHDLRLAGDRLAYVAETDVPDRSGYLWECELEI